MKSRKIISTILASAMVFGLVPGFVFADETEETETEEILVEDVETEDAEAEGILPTELQDEEEVVVEEIDEEEVEATTGTCGENATWSYDEDSKTLTISGEGEMYGYRNVARPWSDYYTEIENLVIEEGITNVGEYAFGGCENLKNISLPDGLLTIDGGAFISCESLVSISIPDSVTSIGGFGNCSSLESVIFGENSELETINGGAFLYCESLQSFTIPSSVTYIRYCAFQNCTSLQDIYCYADHGSLQWDDDDSDSYMPDKGTTVHVSNKKLNDYIYYFSEINVTFEGDLLYEGVCGENATYIFDKDTKTLTISGEGAIYDYSDPAPWKDFEEDIETLIVEEGITSIGDDCFFGCNDLKSVSLPDGLSSIGACAFYWCESLTELEMPDTLEFIGQSAFGMCGGITDVYFYVDPADLTWETVDGYDNFQSDSATRLHVCYGYADVFASKFPGLDVTYVEDRYLNPCGNNCGWTYDEDTKTLTISGQGYTYGYSYPSKPAPWNSFGNDIETLIVEEGITGVSPCCFYGCEGITSISLPDGLKTISLSAFQGCSSLKTLTVPDSLTDIGMLAFAGCTSLETVNFGEDSQLKNIQLNAFSGCESLASFTIPESVIRVSEGAFYGCASLKDIYCYADPGSLSWTDTGSSSYMPDKGTTVHVDGSKLDDFITNFSDVNVAFAGDINYIGRCGENAIYVFDEDTQTLTISGTGEMYDYDQRNNKAPWFASCTIKNVVVEEGITNIGECAFADCRTLEYVTLPEGITSIEYLAFTGCYKLNSFELPTTLESIGDCAFQNCIGFTWVTIPEGVTSINDSFFGCSYVTELYCYADPDELTWYDMTSNDFDRYNRINCHVPYEYLEKYQSKFVGVNVKFVTIPGWITQDGEKYYLKEDGSFYTGWLDFGDGVYYFFDEDGVMQTGWVQEKDYSYYLDEDGVMVTGWKKVDGKYYYFRESGPMKTGWLKDGGKFYYLDLSTGEMAKGWKKISEKWYYFNGGGDMVTGWKKISGKYYYFNNGGDMLTGWLSDGGKYYYLDPSTGAMATGWCKISDKWYYFNGGGDMVTGWKNISGKYYFFKASGAMKTGWFQDGDKKYYLDPSTGEMVTGWKKVSDKWYYFNAGGDIAKGWKKIGNKWYFFKDSGAMQTTNLTYKGKVYYFNSDGSCKNP